MAQEPKSLNISMSPLTSELIPLKIEADLYLQNNSLFSQSLLGPPVTAIS